MTCRGRIERFAGFCYLFNFESCCCMIGFVDEVRDSRLSSSYKVSSNTDKDQICDWYEHKQWLYSLYSRNQVSIYTSLSSRCELSCAYRVAIHPCFLAIHLDQSNFDHLLSLHFLSQLFLRARLRDQHRIEKNLSCSSRIYFRSSHISSLLRVVMFQHIFAYF